jgi:hypothetical protein
VARARPWPRGPLRLPRIPEMKRAAAEIAHKEPRIDVLINNAGAMFSSRRLTEDGGWALLKKDLDTGDHFLEALACQAQRRIGVGFLVVQLRPIAHFTERFARVGAPFIGVGSGFSFFACVTAASHAHVVLRAKALGDRFCGATVYCAHALKLNTKCAILHQFC